MTLCCNQTDTDDSVNILQCSLWGSSSDPSPQSFARSQVQDDGMHFPLRQRNCQGSHSRLSQLASSELSPQSFVESQILNGSVQLRLAHWNWPGGQCRSAKEQTRNVKYMSQRRQRQRLQDKETAKDCKRKYFRNWSNGQTMNNNNHYLKNW